jgi:TPR repeat protein
MRFAVQRPALWAITLGLWCGSAAFAQNPGTPDVAQGLQVDVKGLMVRGEEAYNAHKDDLALKIFHEAAAAGDVEAMMYLGVMFGEGRGATRNYGSALNWFLKAAEAGNGQAMCNIGVLYFQGVGLPRNYTEALHWFVKSAVTGNSEAMFNIGAMERDGLGVPKSDAEALRWFLKAHPGDVSATNAIGVFYQQGRAVERDYSEAMNYYRQAAGQGNSAAMYNIGVLYEGGLGVTMDKDQAIAWYKKAAAANSDDAKTALKNLGASQ